MRGSVEISKNAVVKTRIDTLWLFLSSVFWGVVFSPVLNRCTSKPFADVVNSIAVSVIFVLVFSFWSFLGIKEHKSSLWYFGLAFLCAVFAVVVRWCGMAFYGL